MTRKQIRLVQNSWALVLPISEKVAALFHRRLFQLKPEYQVLFTSDPTELGCKLVHMIDVAVVGLRTFEMVVPALEDLGRRHRDYHVTEEMYGPMSEALLWALKQGLGLSFTDDVEEAWAEFYNMLADVMKSAAYAYA